MSYNENEHGSSVIIVYLGMTIWGVMVGLGVGWLIWSH